MEIVSCKLLYALLTPLIGALVVMRCGKHPDLREGVSVVASVSMFCLVLSMIPDVLAGNRLVYNLFNILPGLTITLRADGLSMVFAIVSSFLWMLAVFYSMGYMRALKEHAQTRFNACFALALFGAIGVAFSDNLFTMYLFYEIVSVCTYPLVAHHQDKESYSGARK